jgi:hypothetical protein
MRCIPSNDDQARLVVGRECGPTRVSGPEGGPQRTQEVNLRTNAHSSRNERCVRGVQINNISVQAMHG